MDRQFHPVAGLFPPLGGVAFRALVDDIQANGLRNPILVDGAGAIVDGKNRYRACLSAGIEPRFVSLDHHEDLLEVALKLNLNRRHLDESQRALVAVRLARLLQGRRSFRGADLHHGRIPRDRSHDLAAAALRVSRRLVMYASRLLSRGCPDLVAAVESGLVAVSAAAVLTDFTHDEQSEIVAAGRSELKRNATMLRREKLPDHPTWQFGVVPDDGPGTLRIGFTDGRPDVGLIWVSARGMDDAVRILKINGFRYRQIKTSG